MQALDAVQAAGPLAIIRSRFRYTFVLNFAPSIS